MTTKTLIRGGTVVSMDPQIGDLTGDVLDRGRQDRLSRARTSAPTLT